jgi:hypothetical protein
VSRARIAIAGLTLVALAGLWLWQRERTGQIEACLAQGGVWDGARHGCRPVRGPILERDGLKRT